jgi:hypothetical protein
VSKISYRIHTFLCDALIDGLDDPPCMFASTQPYQDMSVRESRTWSRQQGWHFGPGGRAICPTCWVEGYRWENTRSS